jgi:CRP/FNR family cyclic AMP-dependent transcriptional regulator
MALQRLEKAQWIQVVYGGVKVLNRDSEGREVILTLLGAGECFGEMGLIDGSPRSANVVAAEACELMFLGKDAFLRCLQDNFQVTHKLMRMLVQRLREADRKIESLALLDVYGRVARLLLDMSVDVDGLRVVKKKMSKQDMAKMIGASREMVSKVMRDLEIRGYIRYDDDLLVIPGV